MKKILFLLISVLTFSTVEAQTKVGSATLPNVETFKDQTLLLNGSGVREKFWIDLYAAGFYVNEKTKDANSFLNGDKPMAIKLHIVSNMITSKKLIGAVEDGFDKSTNGNTAPIQSEIDRMLGYFKDEITKDDVFDLVYIPSVGVVAYKNGVERGVVKGKEFKKALFGIWLSDRAADNGLRDDLLGI